RTRRIVDAECGGGQRAVLPLARRFRVARDLPARRLSRRLDLRGSALLEPAVDRDAGEDGIHAVVHLELDGSPVTHARALRVALLECGGEFSLDLRLAGAERHRVGLGHVLRLTGGDAGLLLGTRLLLRGGALRLGGAASHGTGRENRRHPERDQRSPNHLRPHHAIPSLSSLLCWSCVQSRTKEMNLYCPSTSAMDPSLTCSGSGDPSSNVKVSCL